MSRPPLLLAMLLASTAAAQQQAIIVQNAASPFSNQALAPGSLARISPRIDPAAPPTLPPLDLNRPVSAKLRTAIGFEHDARVLSAESPFSVLVLLPEGVSSGPGELTLFFNGTQSAPAPITIISASPGIYTRPNSLSLANAQVSWEGRTQPNGLTTPARTGGWITLWGTGLGNTPQSNVSANVGGMPAVVGYAGRAPGFPGLDQFNLYLQPGVAYPEGCYVPVEIKVGAFAAVIDANRVDISLTSTGEPCRHHLGLSLDEMRTLDSGGAIPLGELRIVRTVAAREGQPNLFTLNERADLGLLHVDATDFALRPRADILAPNSCRAELSSPGGLGAFRLVSPLDAGNMVTLLGPAGRRADLVPPSPGSGRYEARRPEPPPVSDPSQLSRPFFDTGMWVLNGAGGQDIAPFGIPFRMPPSLRLLNIGDIRVADRARDLTVRWDPAGFDTTDEVLLTLNGPTSTPSSFGIVVGSRNIYCRAAAAQGQITIDKSLLAPFDPHPLNQVVGPNFSLISFATETAVDLPLQNGGRARTVIAPMTGVLAPIRIR